MGGVRWGCKALGDELAKSSPQFAPALARGLATLGKRQELVNISGNRGGGLPGRVSAAAALYDLDPVSGGRLVADLFAQPPADYLVEFLLTPSKKIKEGYRMSLLTLKDGEMIFGGIVHENQNVLVVRSAFGKERLPSRREITPDQCGLHDAKRADCTLAGR
jgi:hypothetical protein